MLRKVFRIGAVLEHVCQLWGPKGSIWGHLGGLLEVDLGVSWRSFWGSLGSFLDVDLEFVEVSLGVGKFRTI